MRPTVKFLNDTLIQQIIDEAKQLLCKLGVEVQNQQALKMLSDSGAKVDMTKNMVLFTEKLIEESIQSTPASFRLYDTHGNETHHFEGHRVYFTPGSAALHILDHETRQIRKPDTADYVQYVKVVNQLKNIASQSTALIPADVHEKISDSYRLFLSLLYGEKPVVTGAFTIDAFEIMKDLQLAVRGNESVLKEKPLTIFSCCPTSPLKWSEVTCQNLMDCARFSIPIELISMPLSGFIAPVSLVGSLIQHTAETLSGVVLSQLSNPGTPLLYGGSPAVFDVRYETTPMGAIETMMIDCAYNEIGKFLHISL
jgi:trimethylamine--corrinoid protein Co-methyltransferase